MLLCCGNPTNPEYTIYTFFFSYMFVGEAQKYLLKNLNAYAVTFYTFKKQTTQKPKFNYNYKKKKLNKV